MPKMMVNSLKKVTFVMIATGADYFEMASNLAKSIKLNYKGTNQTVLLTDQNPLESQKSAIDLSIKIPPLIWPEASALRFQLIYDERENLEGEVIFYVDADSLLLKTFDPDDILPEGKGLFFVEHPGYYKRDLLRWIIKRCINSSWETEKRSWSRVPLWKRRRYVYGAIFGGTRESFIQMIELLARKTKQDIDRGFYPRSYDESYLNAWYANYGGNLLSPQYAWTSKFPWLKNIDNPVVEIIEKENSIVLKKKDLDKN